MLRVALLGPIGAGKTTFANELASQTGGGVGSFAHELRNEIYRAVLINDGLEAAEIARQEMLDPETKDTWRPVLHAWGEMRREQNPDYWVEKLEPVIDQNGAFFVDDCRYSNEYAMLERKGFIFIRLVGRSRYQEDHILEHPSEQQWSTFSAVEVLNTGAEPSEIAASIRCTFEPGRAK